MKKTLHPELVKVYEKHQINDLVISNPHLENFFQELNFEWCKRDEELSQLRPVIDVIPNTISWIKRDLTYIGVNQALAKMCQLTPIDFVGKFVGFHSHDRIIYDFAFELFQGNKKSLIRRIESTINQSAKVFLLIGTMIHDDESIIIGVDVTELEGLKNHVQFNEKLVTLGELFAGIIHDMNNPLTLIEGHVYRLKKLFPNEAQVVESADKISASVQKITKLTRSIRIFTRNENGENVSEEILSKILDDARSMIEHKVMDIQFSFDSEIENYKYVGNVPELFRVFLNLLSNSLDALNDSEIENKWIDVKASRINGFFVLSFIDAGSGIPLSIAEKIFEPFYTTKALGKGTGIGLSLSKKIMNSEGGDLIIDSEARNTTFQVLLPEHRIIKLI